MRGRRVGPRSAVGTVIGGLVGILVCAACVTAQPASPSAGPSVVARISNPVSRTQLGQTPSPGPTPSQTPTPTPRPTPVATVAKTPAATSAATLPPAPTQTEPPPAASATDAGTSSPTLGPSESAEPTSSAPPPSETPRPTLAPGAGLGADTLESVDDFSQPGSWGTASEADGSVSYVDGTLAITVEAARTGLWSWHVPPLPAPHRVLQVEGTISVGDSRGGLMCGDATPDFLFGVISQDGRWYVGSIVSKVTATLASGDIPEEAHVAASARAHLSVECAVSSATSDRVVLRVNGIAAADVDTTQHLGPFDHAAVYGEAGDSPPRTVTFDDVSVRSGDTYTPDGKQDPAVDELLSRVPKDFRSNCTPNQPAGTAGLVAWLVCTPAGDVGEAQYYQFQNKATMNAAFDGHLKRDGSSATGVDCAQRPSTVNYTIRNPDTGVPEHAGRLSCYANPDGPGRLYMWTDEKLAILSFGLATGSYMDLWNWWLDAGPNR
jgi:hypothetical protein